MKFSPSGWACSKTRNTGTSRNTTEQLTLNPKPVFREIPGYSGVPGFSTCCLDESNRCMYFGASQLWDTETRVEFHSISISLEGFLRGLRFPLSSLDSFFLSWIIEQSKMHSVHRVNDLNSQDIVVWSKLLSSSLLFS